MKSVEDPKFLLLGKAKELRKRAGESQELDELIEMAEGIIKQNFYGAFGYMMTAAQLTDMEDHLEELITVMRKGTR